VAQAGDRPLSDQPGHVGGRDRPGEVVALGQVAAELGQGHGLLRLFDPSATVSRCRVAARARMALATADSSGPPATPSTNDLSILTASIGICRG